MKYLPYFLAICLVCMTTVIFTSNVVIAQSVPKWNISTGYIHTTANEASDANLQEVGIEWLSNRLSYGLSFGHYAVQCDGTRNGIDYFNAGTLHVYPIIGHIKVYQKGRGQNATPLGFFLDLGLGLALTDFTERYEGEAQIDNEFVSYMGLGYQWKNWFVEGGYMLGDLNIESGDPNPIIADRVGILEDESNLRGVIIKVGVRF